MSFFAGLYTHSTVTATLQNEMVLHPNEITKRVQQTVAEKNIS